MEGNRLGGKKHARPLSGIQYSRPKRYWYMTTPSDIDNSFTGVPRYQTGIQLLPTFTTDFIAIVLSHVIDAKSLRLQSHKNFDDHAGE
uniref:AlNc14C127G6835 protein n=1 Tax=Albugo laibachii Nc14 TaxID=890382 RepID=F0WJW9_9STRA|nr:AlNc14C127G6835 [Albugo laibachii Nc14]CCA24268.1 AlNc14C230G9288 [Albugo laibachii Nc14]|eukprot:CCA24268.1 AlNc14C230G9288 [Albugo laibachii Nc14]